MHERKNRTRESDAVDLAMEDIARQTSRRGLAGVLLAAARGQTAARRGFVRSASPWKRAVGVRARMLSVSWPPISRCGGLPPHCDLRAWVCGQRDVAPRVDSRRLPAFDVDQPPREADVAALCVSLVREPSILGLLYLESPASERCFTPRRVAAAARLAAHATLTLDAVRLSDALEAAGREKRAAEETLRETHNALLKHQTGRMGDFSNT